MSNSKVVSKTVKCASCNIVISEILAYLQNKVDTMDNESMVRICVSAFTTADVEKAKCLLFDSVKTNKRNISRRKDGKIQRDLEDIIAVFKDTDPDVMPIFVARDLNKLPPVTFDHVDVTALLKDIVRLKADVQEIKTTFVSTKQLQDLENKWFVNNNANTGNAENTKNSGYLLSEETQHELHTVRATSDNRRRHDKSPATSGNLEDVVLSPSRPSSYQLAVSPHKQIDASCLHSPISTVNIATETFGDSSAQNCTGAADNQNNQTSGTEKYSFAEITACTNVCNKQRLDDQWVLVQNKRLRNKFVGNTGKADLNLSSKFKAADIKIPLFVSNVDMAVEESDIADYIYEKTKERVSLLKIKMKQVKGYNSYKVFVSQARINTFLDDNLWPCGITFRRFVNLRQNQNWPDKQN